jgi:Glyoxalase-like domain
MATRVQVTFDCADPDRLAAFWRQSLNYAEQPPPEGHDSWQDFLRSAGVPEEEWNNASATIDPEGVGPRLYFQKVPEGKTVKNRVHLDLPVGAGLDGDERWRHVHSEADRMVGLGASMVGTFDSPFGERWIIMRDPEGNEFCLQ